MKKTTTLNVLTTMAICLFFVSCKKEQGQQTKVEYKIVPMSNTITRIIYNNGAGLSATELDWEKFTNGSRTISPAAKPFTAKLSIDIVNPTLVPIDLDLQIWVDGAPKKTTRVQAPANNLSIFTKEIEYIIK
jgi:hypothetical protein